MSKEAFFHLQISKNSRGTIGTIQANVTSSSLIMFPSIKRAKQLKFDVITEDVIFPKVKMI